MRTLKKSLALVLVVAMAVSLLSVGAFASSSSYTDASSVGATYAEAVDLLTGIGVVSGTTSTTLEPTGNYTREQAAKVICYISLGKTASDALVTGTAPFKDVAADRWSAGYIAYCVSQGIINGRGDGTFDPTGALTGYAWAKLLLTALGNGQSGEYTGNSWEIAVAKDALPLGIFKNDTTAATSKTITRQQAMLLAFNTLFLPTTTVTYSWDGGVRHVASTNKTGASFAASVYGYVSTNVTASKSLNNTLVKVPTSVNGATGYNWYYNNATTAVTGFYSSDSVIKTSTNGSSLSTLSHYTTTNTDYIADLIATPTYLYNGYTCKLPSDLTAAVGDYVISGTAIKPVTTAAVSSTSTPAVLGTTVVDLAAPGYGVAVSLVSTDAAGDTSIAEEVSVSTYTVAVVKAAPVVTVASNGKSYIYISMKDTSDNIGTSTDSQVLASTVSGYTGLVAGDVVLVNTNKNSTVITKAATFSGSATGKTVSGSTVASLTIGGTTYKASAISDSTISGYSQGFLNNVAFYTDASGYLVYASAITSATTNYLYIIQNGKYLSTAVTSASNQSYVAFQDGTTATITVAGKDSYTFANDGSKTMPDVGTVYSYTKNTDGTYTLGAPSLRANSSTTPFTTATNSNGTITTGVASVTYGGSSVKVDANTIFVVRNINATTNVGSNITSNTLDYDATGAAGDVYGAASVKTGTNYYSTWTACTGYANVITASTAYFAAAIGSDGVYADVVFVYDYHTDATTAKNAIYLLGITPTAVYKSASLVDYYTFPAIVDGVQTVVKSTISDVVALDKMGAYAPLAAGMLCSVTYSNGSLIAGSVTPVSPAGFAVATSQGSDLLSRSFVYGNKASGGILSPANGNVSIGGVDYAYSSSTYVFYISADKSTVTMGTADSIADDTTATVTGVTNAASILSANDKASTTAAQEHSLYAIFIQRT